VICCVFYCSEEKAKLLRQITTKIEEKNEELRCIYADCDIFKQFFLLFHCVI